MDNPVISNIFGILGAICWSIQLLPQILKNYRRHNTEGLHPMMYLSWAIAGIPLGVYNLVQNLNIALQIQPNILIFLSLVTWSQCKHYGDTWQMRRILFTAAAIASILGGVEAGLYFALRTAWDKGIKWPMTLMAVLAAIMLCAGVLRYYWEIYQSRDTKGISFLFVFIDYGGDLVSIVALVFAPRLDVVGIVIYSVEASLWIGIQVLGLHFRLRPKLVSRLRQRGNRDEDSERNAVHATGGNRPIASEP